MSPGQQRLQGSCFSVSTILMTVAFVLQAATSLRGSQNCFNLVSTLQGGLPWESPSHTTIQNWILRIGLYELQRAKDFADDWIWIVDSHHPDRGREGIAAPRHRV